MRTIVYIALACLLLGSCKENAQKDSTKGEAATTGKAAEASGSEVKMPTYRGEFIYLDDAAVLKGRDFIYGVKVDEMALELAEQVEKVKEEPYDMVPVIVEGILEDKAEGEEGWDQILTVKKIITVSSKPAKADIQIEQTK